MSDTAATQDEPRYRVMLVDDSSVIRGMLTRILAESSQIEVLSSVGDGQMAVTHLTRTPVDVIVLDVEMPVMDGLTAIPHLLAIDPAIKIIMASTLSLKNAEVSVKALTLGAADYLPKPSAREIAGTNSFKDELISKIIAHGHAARKAGVRGNKNDKPATARLAVAAPAVVSVAVAKPAATTASVGGISLRTAPIVKPDLIAIGSSTGGPQALFATISALGTLPQPVIITQHMPPNFTTVLAEHISSHCKVKCSEAKDGMELQSGHYYLAAGDYHMVLQKRINRIVLTLTQTPPENFCRPAVDVMLRSAIPIYGSKILSIILTGMGQDGCRGSEQIVAAGGAVIAQDEASSVVWGMPAAVTKAGLCSAVLPLDKIGAYARRIALEG